MKPSSTIEHTRSFFIFFILFIFYATIITRLYFMQIKQENFFKKIAEKQYNITISTMPERAHIFDKNGTAIAVNKITYAAFLLPKQITDRSKIVEFLSQHFPQAAARFAENFDKNFFFIARKLTPEQQKIIQESELKEIHLLEEPSRFYPYQCLGTVVGITDIDNHGILGLEQQYDDILQGTETVHTLKKDARSNHFYFEQELTVQGKESQPLYLTIDADLQYKVTEILEQTVKEFEAKEGAILIMNPENGEICTMASYPYFDPNHIENLDMETTKNRPASQAFESGSVIKTFSALAALDLQIVTLDEMINCENTKETKIEGIRVRTVQPHGIISFKEVVQFSNNIGTVKIIKRINEKLYDYYCMLGFGQQTGLNFPGEHKGFVNPPKNWSAYSIISLSFGYEITTTLLQLARALSVVYNGGHLITPTLIKNKDNQNITTEEIITQQTRTDIDTILQGCVKEGSGKKADIFGYKVTGKTGTANILENGKYNEDKHLNSFIGYIEKDDYKRIITVYVKESKKATYSSVITAPLFKKTAETLLIHDHILPK